MTRAQKTPAKPKTPSELAEAIVSSNSTANKFLGPRRLRTTQPPREPLTEGPTTAAATPTVAAPTSPVVAAASPPATPAPVPAAVTAPPAPVAETAPATIDSPVAVPPAPATPPVAAPPAPLAAPMTSPLAAPAAPLASPLAALASPLASPLSATAAPPATPTLNRPPSGRDDRPAPTLRPLGPVQFPSQLLPMSPSSSQPGPAAPPVSFATQQFAAANGQAVRTNRAVASAAAMESATRSAVGQVMRQPINFAHYLDMLQQIVVRNGGVDNLDPDIERSRFELLADACRSEDLFCLMVHQLFNIWTLRREEVYGILSPLSPAEVDGGFEKVQVVLRSNDQIRLNYRQFFTRFPDDLPGLLARHPAFAAMLPHAVIFLRSMRARWSELVGYFCQRPYPVLMDELVGMLGCMSVVLQRSIFDLSKSIMGMPNLYKTRDFEQLFFEDQRCHQPIPGQFIASHFTTLSALERNNLRLIESYGSLVASYQSAAAAAQTAQGQKPGMPAPPLLPQMAQMPQQMPQQMEQWQQEQQWQQQQQAQQARQAQHAERYPRQIQRQSFPLAARQQYLQQPHLDQQLDEAQQLQEQRLRAQALRRQRRQQQQQQQPRPASPPPEQPIAHLQQLQAQLDRQQQAQMQAIQPHVQAQMQMQMAMQAAPPMANQARVLQNRGMVMPRPATPQTPIAMTMTAASLPSAVQRNTSARRSTADTNLLNRPLLSRRRIMRNEYPVSPEDPRSLRGGLHEVLLRSPPQIVYVEDSDEEEEARTERHYQHVHHMAIGPVLAQVRSQLYRFEFRVTPDEYQRLARREVPAGALLPVVRMCNGCLRLRLRCCRSPHAVGSVGADTDMTEAEWATTETTWPVNIFPHLNGQVVAVRRKAHNGKDLPADVTDLVREGVNVLEVAIPQPHPPWDPRWQYVLGVEVIRVDRHRDVLQQILKRGVREAGATVDEIRRRLATTSGAGRGGGRGGNSDNSDDDVAVTQADLAIDLADPFSARAFEVPVRGQHCLHMECFDLGNWLNTRPRRPIGPCGHRLGSCSCRREIRARGHDADAAEPTLPDKWRCPICGRDARPKSLLVDGFLLAVRRQLDARGQLDRARSIRVASDGTWQAVYAAASPEAAIAAVAAVAAPEVVVVDDDDDVGGGDGNVDDDEAARPHKMQRTSMQGVSPVVIELD